MKINKYPNGGKYERGLVVDGKKHGKWEMWYESGELKGIFHYKNGILDGDARQYFKSGGLEGIAKYKNGKFIDTVKYYYSNGKLNFSKYFDENGKQQGKSSIWYENGELQQEGEYKDGIKNGKWLSFFNNGRLETISFYKTGNKVGVWIYYNILGDTVKREAY